jgi:hypothetical protein
MRRLKKPNHNSKKLKKEKMEYWSERNAVQEFKTSGLKKDSVFSVGIIEYQKELAKNLHKMRLEYIEKHHREPDFSDYEFGLIAKYC